MKTLSVLPAIETPQLILREIEPRDALNFARFMMQPAYQRHIAMQFRTEAEVKAFVTRQVARQGDERRNVFHLAAEEKLSGEAIGDGFIIIQKSDGAEVGWGVHPAMWAMGLGSEIGRALLGLAFERLQAKRVWCKIMAVNAPSLKLARRVGFRHVKSHADYPAGGGRFEPIELFALTADDYFDAPY